MCEVTDICNPRGQLSPVSTIEEVLGRKSSDCGLENRDYGHRGLRGADHATPLYPEKLTLTSPVNGGRTVGRVRRLRPRSL
jgi:hypothetical protein